MMKMRLWKLKRKLQRFRHMRSGFIQLCIGISVIMMIIWTGNEAEAGQYFTDTYCGFYINDACDYDALAPTAEAIEQMPDYEESLSRLKEIENATIPVGCKTCESDRRRD